MASPSKFKVGKVSTSSSDITTTPALLKFGFLIYDIGGTGGGGAGSGWDGASRWFVPAGEYLIGWALFFSNITNGAQLQLYLGGNGGGYAVALDYRRNNSGAVDSMGFIGSFLFTPTGNDDVSLTAHVSTGNATFDGAAQNSFFWGIKTG